MHLDAARSLALTLMAQHGLDSWTFGFDRAKTRAGVCRFAAREIGLSRHLTALHDEPEVRDTVLHEIAHALVGPGHGHDAQWRAVALRIGCSGTRCVGVDQPRVEGAWLGICPIGHSNRRHRRPTRVVTCSRCSPAFDIRHVLTWTHHGRPAAMHPNYLAELELHQGDVPPSRSPLLLGPGAAVVVTAPGEFDGLRGRIVQRRRTRYRVQTSAGTLEVTFAGVAAL